MKQNRSASLAQGAPPALLCSQDVACCVVSLGCAKNEVDSERLLGRLSSAGYRIASEPDKADIIILNTCGFITEAKEESIAAIFEALDLKKRAGRPDRMVVVAGCLSKRYRDEIAADIPEIDLIYGLLDEAFVKRMSMEFGIAALQPTPCRRPLRPNASYAYLKIAEGCSNDCSYCAIPLIRGPAVSYPPDLLLAEAREAVAAGAREIVVIAQDIGAYRAQDCDLRELVERLSEIEGIDWLRLMYCHPRRIDDRIIGTLERGAPVVPYLDVPFQHASARILQSMGRGGDAESHLRLIESLRMRVPSIRIRSTLMVGYPGETEEEFEELIAFLRAASLDRVGAFMYSAEEGTRACRLGDTVPKRVKEERYRRLMNAQREISSGRLESMIGAVVDVIVEERIDRFTWAGRTMYDAPEVDGVFYLTASHAAVNEMVRARVTGATEYDLIGEAV